MLSNIAPLIVGVKYYKSQCRAELPTVWLTSSLEAFDISCLENYYDNVVDATLNRDPTRKPKWTLEGVRAKRNQGWKQEGITKPNEYCKKVEMEKRTTIDVTHVLVEANELVVNIWKWQIHYC